MLVQNFRRNLIFRLVVVSCLLGTSGRAQTPAPLPAALPEDLIPELKSLLDKAMTQSPQMLSRSIEIAAAEATRYQQSAGLYPSVGGYVSYASNETAVSERQDIKSKSDGLYYSFSVTQPIFHWGALKAQSDIGKLGVKMAERQYVEAYRQLAYTVRTQYLALIGKKIVLRNVQNGLRLMEGDLSVQETRLKNGAISAGEIIGPRLQVEENRIYVERSAQDYDYSRRVLAQLVGITDLADDQVVNQVPKPTYPKDIIASYVESLGRAAVESMPIAVFHKYGIEQAELNYKIARTRLLPKVGLSASYGVSNQTNASTDNVSQVGITTTSVGLAASWSIFDGFATRGAKLAALATKRASERALQTYVDSVGLQLENTEKQLGFSARLMDLTETRFALATDGVKLTNDNVRLGRSPQTALDSATQSAYLAELNLIQARSEYFSRWCEYITILGLDPVMQNLPARYLRNGK